MKRLEGTHPPIIALTGTIGSGKSTVARQLQKLGAVLIDADQLARDAVQPNTPALTRIIGLFGPSVVAEDGTLNRKALSEIVFSNDLKRADLESIVHPEVRRLFTERLTTILSDAATPPPLIVYEVPLFFESKNSYPEISQVVVVSASPEICISRIMARDGCTHEKAAQRLKTQMPNAEKERRADYVIYNESTVSALQEAVERLYTTLINHNRGR